MDKKGTIQVLENSREEKLDRLKQLMAEVTDDDAVMVWSVLSMRKLERSNLAEAMYPMEFLCAMKDTLIETLENYMKDIGAQTDAIDLFSELCSLMMYMAEVEKGHGFINDLSNKIQISNLAAASRHVVSVGGKFYGPYGETA